MYIFLNLDRQLFVDGELTFLGVQMLLPSVLEHALKSAVYELVTAAKILQAMGREEDSKCALELSRDICGLFPDPE